jgi:hypothetical protein
MESGAEGGLAEGEHFGEEGVQHPKKMGLVR